MDEMMQVIGSAMQADVNALRVTSQNIANAQTMAYRRQIVVDHVQFEQLLGQASAHQHAESSSTRIALDSQPGTFKSTGEPLDVALSGPGFLALQGERGLLLTRRGDFHLGSDGTLLSSTGIPVLGKRGTLQLGAGAVTITADGTVRVNNDVIDQLRVVGVPDSTRLVPLGDGTYAADAADVQEGDGGGVIKQGFLETSNVAPVNEMVNLMDTVRRFEAEQKFVHAYDAMLDKAISVIGKGG